MKAVNLVKKSITASERINFS